MSEATDFASRRPFNALWAGAVVSGILSGAGHLASGAWGLHWAGIVLFGYTLQRHRATPALTIFFAVFLNRAIETAITEHWLYFTLTHYLELNGLQAVLGCVFIWGLSTLVRVAPTALSSVSWCARRPIWPWVYSLGIATGEALWHHYAAWSWSDGFYAHAGDPLLRGALAWTGWSLTTVIVFGLGTSAGVELYARNWGRFATWVVVLVELSALPTRGYDPDALAGVWLPPMRWTDQSVTAPPGTRLVILPELAVSIRARVGYATRVKTALARQGAPISVLEGAIATVEDGLANVAWGVDDRDRVVGVHIKQILVPGGEQRVFGVLVGDGFIQGTRWDVLSLGGHRVLPLLCLEALDRGWIPQARESADFVAVMASDRPLEGSEIAREQAEGIARLRSVESGLPVVRTGLGGATAIWWPDGSSSRAN